MGVVVVVVICDVLRFLLGTSLANLKQKTITKTIKVFQFWSDYWSGGCMCVASGKYR